MLTPQQQRRERLASDYKEMRAIRGKIIDWQPERGTEPHFDRYSVTVHVRTIVGPRPDYAPAMRLSVDLPSNYPYAPPSVRALTRPFPFHPNWWADGRWCSGNWAPMEGLGAHIIRMVRILQFDPAIANLNSPANMPALQWWKQMASRGLFPCDRSILPDPLASPKIAIKEIKPSTQEKPRIKIRPLNP